MDKRRLVMACAIITLAALGIISVVIMSMTRNNAQHSNPITTPVTLSGNLACLPHKNTSPNQPQTQECAIGLKTDDGRYYSLQNLPQGAAMTPFTKHITVSGDILPPTDDRYDIRGILKVTTFTQQ